MSVDRAINASAEDTFAVLSDGWLYGGWVVGTSHVRAVEPDWPAVGARLFHATGAWPMVTRDETVVEVSHAPYRLVLLAKGGPLGNARIELDLRTVGEGCRVSMLETPVQGMGRWLHNPVSAAGIHRRNVEALSRLATIAERRAVPRD